MMLMKSDERETIVTRVLLLLFSVVLTVFGRIFSSSSSRSDLTLEKKISEYTVLQQNHYANSCMRGGRCLCRE